ncbi:hypothetical protein ACFVTJ_13595 [Agrobacterium sp. NPDC058088]|uniref:hypothetical protein n=1 Tax=Agrobacterium sp. NPDC058088 TaxID=3346335 RepID=UPI0036DAA683
MRWSSVTVVAIHSIPKVNRQRKRVAILRLAMPSNNTPFDLVHNPGEISAATIEKAGALFLRQTLRPRPTMQLLPEMILAFFSCIAQNPDNFRGADNRINRKNRARQINGDQSEHLSSDAL